MVTLAPESPDDHPTIDALLDEAFGPDRFRKTSYRYRQGVAPIESLCMTAHDGDRLVGSIRYWPIRVGADGQPALLLGPLAVSSHSQGTGVGAALVFTTLDAAASDGHDLVLLVGDLPYYSRFGFVPAAPHGIVMPDENPDRLLLTTLAPNAARYAAGPVQPWQNKPEHHKIGFGPTLAAGANKTPMTRALDA